LLNPVAGDAAALALRVTLLANNRDHNGETWEDGFQPTLSTTDDMLRVADGEAIHAFDPRFRSARRAARSS
jgi:hypothetical protein